VHGAVVDWQPLQAANASGTPRKLGNGVATPFSNLMHWLVVVVMPEPQVTEQEEGVPFRQVYVAQGFKVHGAVVDWQPLQAAKASGTPRKLGNGTDTPFSNFMHWLVVVVMPEPQVTEQAEAVPLWQLYLAQGCRPWQACGAPEHGRPAAAHRSRPTLRPVLDDWHVKIGCWKPLPHVTGQAENPAGTHVKLSITNEAGPMNSAES
jgi:hypothetical protein